MPVTYDQAHQYRRTGYWPDKTLHEWLDKNAIERPNALAVKDAPNRFNLTGQEALQFTWAELKAVADNMSHDLSDLGLAKGDIALVQMPNIVDLVVLYYALSRLGVLISPIPVQYGAHEIATAHSVLKNRYAITLESFQGRPLPLAQSGISSMTLLTLGEDLALDPNARAQESQFEKIDADHILTICWTSGTTGTPKGVPRHHNHWMAVGHCNIQGCGYRPGDVLLNPFPLVNMAALGGFLAPAAMSGATLILHHPIDVPIFLKQLEQERATFTIAPPALLNQLASQPALWGQFDFSQLRAIGSGAAPLSPWMIETFEQTYGKTIINFYGSNEGIALHSTPATAPEAEWRAAYFKRPEPDASIQAAVADPDSQEILLGVGAVGELLMGGPTVFDGYYGRDNSDVFAANGYFRTGDLVEIAGDSGEYLRIVGRCKEMINRGGFKISPVEIDGLLEKLPGVVQAAAFVVPDDRLGERVGAAIVLSADQTQFTLAELQKSFEDLGVAKFKWPEKLVFLNDLPRNPLAKVQRFVLTELYGDFTA